MSKLVRFGISLEDGLLKDFDKYIREKEYKNRSEAIRDLIRERFVKTEWAKGKEVAGAIILVYDHHKRELVNKLTDIQHDFHNLVICNQHIHLDHHNCMEIIVVKGTYKQMSELADKLQSTKGVKSASLNIAEAH